LFCQNAESSVFAFFEVQDFHFGICADAKQSRWRREANGLVKARFEVARWPVHKDNGGALADAKDTAKPMVVSDNVTGA
jgi:hypothetical protein